MSFVSIVKLPTPDEFRKMMGIAEAELKAEKARCYTEDKKNAVIKESLKWLLERVTVRAHCYRSDDTLHIILPIHQSYLELCKDVESRLEKAGIRLDGRE